MFLVLMFEVDAKSASKFPGMGFTGDFLGGALLWGRQEVLSSGDFLGGALLWEVLSLGISWEVDAKSASKFLWYGIHWGFTSKLPRDSQGTLSLGTPYSDSLGPPMDFLGAS